MEQMEVPNVAVSIDYARGRSQQLLSLTIVSPFAFSGPLCLHLEEEQLGASWQEGFSISFYGNC